MAGGQGAPGAMGKPPPGMPGPYGALAGGPTPATNALAGGPPPQMPQTFPAQSLQGGVPPLVQGLMGAGQPPPQMPQTFPAQGMQDALRMRAEQMQNMVQAGRPEWANFAGAPGMPPVQGAAAGLMNPAQAQAYQQQMNPALQGAKMNQQALAQAQALRQRMAQAPQQQLPQQRPVQRWPQYGGFRASGNPLNRGGSR